MKKDINIIRKKWLRESSLTAILIIFLIAGFIVLNYVINNLDLNPIDVTKEKLYTLSEESKNKIKEIDKKVNIYFFGYDESNSIIILAKQYHNINDKILAESIDINTRPDLAQKYGIDSNNSVGIVVESPDRYKILTSSDFVTYDVNTYETIDITEQKLTNAIIDTTIAKKPNIYFLEGHGEKARDEELVTLEAFLENEINNISSLDLLNKDIPEDCDCLAIIDPQKDFAELETNKIIEYINKGGKILWLNNPYLKEVDFPNINKILEIYGFNFSKGLIGEQDENRIILNNPFLILTDISNGQITKDLYKIVLAGAGKINFQDDEKLNELGLEVNNLITSSEKSVYIEDYTAESISKLENFENGPFIVGAEINKKINEDTVSKMIVFSNSNFITDDTASESSSLKLINLYSNRDLILNSVAYLTDREDEIKIRKNPGMVLYMATNKQDLIVRIIIFLVPIIIIFTGIIIGGIRNRKN